MEPLVKVKGIVAPLDRVNVDTDAIIPKQFLKRIERSGFGQFLFYEFRFDEQGNPIKDFVLNKDEYKGTNILLSRANFGCGSSREHAPWALADFGFRVIIASSFADIFHNNCFNNGILPVKLTVEQVDELFKRAESIEGYQLEVDLEAKKVRDNQGLEYNFEVEDFARHKLLNGLDEIGLTLLHKDKIDAFEKQHKIYI
ncbi:3-isopropylmalate dehydratase small subunit 1 [Clostridium homopropionicum DSM 5847]|uniref:3-isopropylmalate dehydratase small subunit n=1 Tax=Clostridium homopropionicum DSM 5847 TaxID=1121318 RepID=A0A0L6Z6W5_9CLOT|nr:3-isopropylmalate dehydratase small subunit [Clostridium homopropionicum]KOA18702.1 3-isopropylmalate dehydratase small subunit 1 [Clostridium homopropionicum DSM 5847]SFG53197.1 3-isopropylmalate/(R)-2-methylmalate dehydratase small subunit [Clostridium homopropionicum]